ncbi:MAG TPA: nitrate reductase associated protein, partial [Chitinophagaceae bacterium]|nr:nitrate reductase associated protein [Chitinophagaceae bacterium]
METGIVLPIMSKGLKIKRTSSADPDFQLLISHLDHELWNELKEDQATYDQYNKVPDLQTALVLYINKKPAASGCFKKYDTDTVEIKRMFVEQGYRGRGLSKHVLDELEKWAVEMGYEYAVLETSIHFNTAKGLYTNAGYVIIANYGQYAGLKDSVCMKKKLMQVSASEFKNIPDIEYFDFEEDFAEKNIRCIPMIVRFKMDHAGIKLKLSEWSKFSVEERIELAKKNCSNEEEARLYNFFLAGLIKKYTGNQATDLKIDQNPAWADVDRVPVVLNEKLKQFGWNISTPDWKRLNDLQRFVLLKLCKEGHENKNFPKAMREF